MPVQMQCEPNDICVLRFSGILKRSEFGAEERAFARHIVWPHFWAIQIILFLLILVYCTAQNWRACSGGKDVAVILWAKSTSGILSENYGFVPCWTFIHVSGLSHRDGTKVPLLNCLAFLKLCGVGIDL